MIVDKREQSLARNLAASVLRGVIDTTKEWNPGAGDRVTSMFLASFLQLLVQKALQEIPDNVFTPDELFHFSKLGLAETKVLVQNSIAAGFQKATSNFTGQDVEYYCQVRVVPEPVSRTIN